MRIYKKPYKPEYVKHFARKLRNNLTESEKVLWEVLKGKSFYGYRFRRQVPFGRFIFDFYCPEKKFAIEIDGKSHIGKEAYDNYRDEFVSSCNVKVFRVSDTEVIHDLKSVLKKIKSALQ